MMRERMETENDATNKNGKMQVDAKLDGNIFTPVIEQC